MGSKKTSQQQKQQETLKVQQDTPSTSSDSENAPQLNITPPQPKPNGVAVIINGKKIKESQIEKQVDENLQRLPAQIPQKTLEQYRQRMRSQILQQIIVENLLEEQAQKKDIEITDQQVIDYIKEQASQQETPMSIEEVKQLVEAQGQDFEQVKQDLAEQLKYKELLEKQFEGKIEVTEEEAKEYYENNKQQFANPEQVRASHILIKPDTSDPNIDPNQADLQAKQKAETLLKQIKEGADFAELAKTNSDCPSSRGGGDLGFFSKGKMVPAFEEAAFALDVNEVSDVVKTRFGYHIIKKTDQKEASTTSFEEAKETIIEQLKNQKKTQLARDYINKLKGEADIRYPNQPNTAPTQSAPQSPSSNIPRQPVN